MRTRIWALGVSVVAVICSTSMREAGAVGYVGLTTPTNGGWVSGTPTLRWSAATAATSYTLTITPTVGSPFVKEGLTTNAYTLTAGEALATSAGPYSWRVTAYDAANASSTSSLWSFFVDTSPPTSFSITSPEANAWTNTWNALVLWTPAVDTGSGIAAYHAYVDGVLCSDENATSTGASLSLSTCKPGEGLHYWSVSVEDAVGNLAWCADCAAGAAGRAFRIDETGPADLAVTGGTFQIASNDEPTYYGNVNDRMVDTGITITAGQPLSISATGSWCTLGCASSIGCYTVSGSSSSSAVVPAPNCAPFSLIARIGSTFFCIGSGSNFNPTASGKLSLGINSEYTGCSTPTVTATVTGGRSFQLISPAANAFLSDRFPLFSWHAATDAGSGGVNYRAQIGAVGVTGTLTPATTATTATLPDALADGTYEWLVVAYDAAKNRTESVVQRFTIDTAKPGDFRLSSPADGACSSVPTPSLCWASAADSGGIASHQLVIDDVSVAVSGSCTTPAAPLSQGLHSWYVVQTDRAGNWRQSSDTRQFWVDYTAPTAPALSTPGEGASLVDPPSFTWTVAADNLGIKSYEVYVDGTLAATLDASKSSYLQRTDLALGNHTWYVRALDRCGQAAPSAVRPFTMVACSADGVQHPCPGYDLGRCQPGTRSCTATGTWSSCSNAILPAGELCNDIDDNCDGIVDNSTATGVDNQCGGVCTVTPPYIWSACDGSDADRCAEGHIACDGLNRTVCVETTPNNVEACNGRDDDCNGVIDDAPVCSTTGTGGTTGTFGGTSGVGSTAGTYGGTTGTYGGAMGTYGGAMGTYGGTMGTFGGTNGVGGLVASNAGTAGRIANGGQLNVSAGGTTSLSSVGGSTTTIGGAVAVSLGGSAGMPSASTDAGAGHSSGGDVGVTSAGGTTANGTTIANVNAGKSSGGAVLTAGAAGLGTGPVNEEPECDCRFVSASRSSGRWVLLGALAMLLLGRRNGRRRSSSANRHC